jgi:hypothetical protein
MATFGAGAPRTESNGLIATVTAFNTVPVPTSVTWTNPGIDTYYTAGDDPTRITPDVQNADICLALTLSGFTASFDVSHVALQWSTISEIENLGWHVYRSEDESGPYQPVSAQLVPGAGTSVQPQSYQFIDDSAEEGKIYYYYLEDVSLDGQRARSPIIRVDTSNQRVDALEKVIPIAGQVPRLPRLFQNYPNPFNPETWIPYQLFEPTDAKIEVYDMHGGLVRTLVLGYRIAGAYTSRDTAARWDGRDELGCLVGSGVYFYRLLTSDCSIMQKMVIVK